MANSLVSLDRIAAQLAKAVDAEVLADLRNRARAIEVYAKTTKHCQEIERSATIVRLRAERRIGQILSKSVKAGNPQLSSRTTIQKIPSGISRDQSSKFQIIARLPEEHFEKLLTRKAVSTKAVLGAAHLYRRQRRNARGPSKGCNVYTGDMTVLSRRLTDGSVAMFLTDPPYAETDQYGRLAKLAAAKLRDGGLCCAYAGINKLPEVLQLMGEHLQYHWTFSIAHSGPHRAFWAKRIQNCWRPIVIFSKGARTDHGFVDDFIQSRGREKQLHDWQQEQSEAEYLIEKLTSKGDLIVDPYCGSGTTLVAAKKLGRDYIGCEIDSATARGARKRITA